MKDSRWARVAALALLLFPGGFTSTWAKPASNPLPPAGTTHEARINGGDIHHFSFVPQRDEEVAVTIEQLGIDLVAAVLGEDRSEQLAVDSRSAHWGTEPLVFGARAGTPYSLEIRTQLGDAAGRYRLRVETLPTSASDLLRRDALRALSEGAQRNRRGTRTALTEAVDFYATAVEIWRQLPDPRELAEALALQGLAHHAIGERQEALQLLRQAKDLRQQQGDQIGEARAWAEIGFVHRARGETEEAESAHTRSLSLWRKLGLEAPQARILNFMGLLRMRSSPRDAVAPFEEALELFQRAGDRRQQGVVLNNLGGVADLLGEPHAALHRFRQALAVHQELDDTKQQAAVWNNMASVFRRSGQYQEALATYGRSLEARQKIGDLKGEARVRNNLGLSYLGLGDLSRAQHALEASLELRRKARDQRGEAVTLHNLGMVEIHQKEWQAALPYFRSALDIRRKIGSRHGEANDLLRIGYAQTQLGQVTSARQHLGKALEILEVSDRPWLLGLALQIFGEVLLEAGEPQQASRTLLRSLDLMRSTGDTFNQSRALVILARAEAGADLEKAHHHALAALDLLENARTDVDSLELRSSLLSHYGDAFELAIDLSLRLHAGAPDAGWSARALEIAERARARSLLDLLEESGSGLRRDIDQELAARQKSLLETLQAKVSRRRSHLERGGDAEQAARWDREVQEARNALTEVENEIRRASPRWAALTRPRPLSAVEIRTLLDPDTLLLQFALGSERSTLWLVSSDAVDSFELPDRATINSLAREVYTGWSVLDPGATSADRKASQRLSQMLLGPVAEHLAGQRLVIVADGALHYLPFAALPRPGAESPLLVDHEIVALPSASALAIQRSTRADRQPASKQLAVLADPVFGVPDPRLPSPAHHQEVATSADTRMRGLDLERLAWSAWEAEAIAARLPPEQTRLIRGFDANLAAVTGDQLRDFRMVHFATHGVIDSEHPELSALALSMRDPVGRPQRGFLRLAEIYNLELDAELVVLSGCRTALGPEIRGEGLVGLTRGFFAAGARKLVASLWRVQDRAAAELMDHFYQELLGASGDTSLRPARALRAAQLEMSTDPRYRDPYYWAAFAAYGDWR